VRMSRLFGETLRDGACRDRVGWSSVPVEGRLRPPARPGIFSYLPLGWQAMQHIERILRERWPPSALSRSRSLSCIPPSSGSKAARYQKIGAELTRFRDRRDREMVLAMTHEEVVATLATSEISSWRQLPKMVFQIQIKWRDDPRPRAGMIAPASSR